MKVRSQPEDGAKTRLIGREPEFRVFVASSHVRAGKIRLGGELGKRLASKAVLYVLMNLGNGHVRTLTLKIQGVMLKVAVFRHLSPSRKSLCIHAIYIALVCYALLALIVKHFSSGVQLRSGVGTVGQTVVKTFVSVNTHPFYHTVPD